MTSGSDDVAGGLGEIAGVGRDPVRGGYSRHGYAAAELTLREWFAEAAGRLGLEPETDGNGNIWAWWDGRRGPDALVTGSHLDSVPGGGAFDGPLGVVSALAAVESLRAGGFTPRRPLAVAVFVEEEGGRFGLPCLGSRLLTGALPADATLRRTDPDGLPLADAMRAAGLDPERVGPDPDRLAGIGAFVELHVEQGTLLGPTGAAVGVATGIVAHGRWRFRFTGQGNHAGTTAMDERHDPMLAAAATVLAVREIAVARGSRATVGRLQPTPGGTNVIASTVEFWLDARAERDGEVRATVDAISSAARRLAREQGCSVEVTEESASERVDFPAGLRAELTALLGSEALAGGEVAPQVPTGAGHDAGVLAPHVPSGMIFVRNPTGISHAPEEHAEPADCAAGVRALTTVLRRLAGP
jgi:N-carbamoyl-L-amino-acid hydrolase